MKKISIAIMVLVVVLASCKKTPEVNLKYVDVERDLITVGTTTATVQCDYQYIATLKKAYLYYGEDENEVDMNTAEMRVVQNTLYVDLAGLTANTTYNYYYEFHNGFNSMRTALKTFKTEGGSGPAIILPTVVTGEVTEITTSSAKGSGEVTNDGGAEVTERGICWSTNENPTLSDNYVAAGTGTGAFTAMMNDLEEGITYHVRAYATNEVGTAYGLDREFVTNGGGSSNVPEGAINGLFTINANGDQVYFSQGNLQYQASTNTWRFAEHQWDYVGGVDTELGIEYGNVYENGIKCDNGSISHNYNGWIDLFGWGTSGWNSGNIYFNPWDTTIVHNEYGPINSDLSGNNSNSDWGIYNSILNGGRKVGLWRCLSQAEWHYLILERNTISNLLWAKAIVNNLKGVVVFPDDWDNELYSVVKPNDQWSPDYGDNIITGEIWFTVFEENGAVFLPAACYRYGTNINGFGSHDYGDGLASYGLYWSASTYNDLYANSFNFYYYNCSPDCQNSRAVGSSVRLVQDANPQNIIK